MTEPFRLRRATADDSRRAFDVFIPSARDLTTRQGVEWDVDAATLWPRMEPLFDHLAAHTAEWWLAEDPESGEVIGYARSVQRGGLLELSEFFVHPERQSAGIGSALLERAFPEDRGEVRAIIATTDVRALSRYYRAGTAARFPIMSMVGAPRDDKMADATVEADRADADDVPQLVEIERAVLEFDRGDEFLWLLEQREGYVYRRRGVPIGFAFLGTGGAGPIAALDPADEVSILAHVERRAAALGIGELTLEVPLVNDVAVRHLLGRGFTIDPFVAFLMSSRPFGSFDRFIGFSPQFVL